MKRNLLALVIVSIALLSLGLTSVFTGFFTTVSFSIGVTSLKLGKIMDIDHQLTVKEYDPLNGTVVFKNVGSASFVVQIVVKIEDINLTSTIINFTDGNFTLQPGEERVFEFVHYPTEAGLYWVHADVTYDEKKAHGFSLFFVEELYPSTDGGAGGDGGGGTTPIEIGTPAMELDYTKYIILSPGQSSAIFVKVDNTGNISLNTIKILGTADFPFLAEPTIITKLSPDLSAVFLLTLSIPIKMEPGTYFLNFVVDADEMSKTGRIRIIVEERSIQDEVWQTILNYRYIIQRLEGEIKKAREDGKDVAKAAAALGQARQELNVAEQLFGQEKYFEARDQLLVVKVKLIVVVRLLALLGIPFFAVILPGLLPLIIIIVVMMVVIVYILLLYRKRRRRPKELE